MAQAESHTSGITLPDSCAVAFSASRTTAVLLPGARPGNPVLSDQNEVVVLTLGQQAQTVPRF